MQISTIKCRLTRSFIIEKNTDSRDSYFKDRDIELFFYLTQYWEGSLVPQNQMALPITSLFLGYYRKWHTDSIHIFTMLHILNKLLFLEKTKTCWSLSFFYRCIWVSFIFLVAIVLLTLILLLSLINPCFFPCRSSSSFSPWKCLRKTEIKML